MSIFDWFRLNKRSIEKPSQSRVPKTTPTQSINKAPTPKPEKRGPPENLDDLVDHDKDFLGKAAKAKHQALAAIKARDFDTAWKHLHEQKGFYLQHASRVGFTPQQTVALDASVSENMANILRMEGKHKEAFVHILYWAISSTRSTKNQENKLLAYYKRAKFFKIGLMDVHQFIEDNSPMPDYREIQNAVKVWSEATKD